MTPVVIGATFITRRCADMGLRLILVGLMRLEQTGQAAEVPKRRHHPIVSPDGMNQP
ncbi:hypothetical protein [Trichothermofontia sp.]